MPTSETRNAILRRLEKECRDELRPINDERMEIYNKSIRPIYAKDGLIEYGEFPTEIKIILNHLDEKATAIVHKYEKMAAAETNRTFMENHADAQDKKEQPDDAD